MKKALSCLGLALALVSIPQFASASEAAKEVVSQEKNATVVVKKAEKAVDETAEKATEKVADEATR